MSVDESLFQKGPEGMLSLRAGGLQFILALASMDSDEKIGLGHNGQRIVFRVHPGHIPHISNKVPVFDSGSVWSLFLNEDIYFLQNCQLTYESIPETLIRFAPDFRGGDAYLKNPVVDQSLWLDLFGYPLNQILMILLLSSRNGMVVHACGINDSGRGYLFLGNSTSGKSTLAKIWHEKGATVLNDDRIILREKDGAFRMYGTPWHGTFAETSLTELPVEKIFFLKHGTENLLFPKSGSEAVSMLLTRSFPPFWDQWGMEQVLGLLDRMAKALPCYELQFLPDERVLDLIRNLNS
jgi:hypothetical protein